jgi:glycosyltransferase involved in cell wall biosynthesis
MASQPFSLLLPFYAGDAADHLARSLRSAVDEQERPPNEVVLVRDGPVAAEADALVSEFRARAAVPVSVLTLPQNRGLSSALEVGLAACRYDLVARQDADDISLPQRFSVQLPVVESGVDVVGSGLLEFGADEHDIIRRRTPPLEPTTIAAYARVASPFNHPSVVYRRSAVAAVGGYERLPLLEDYWLFVRMIHAGARVANVPDPLVLYRVGSGAYNRRGGWALVRSELELQRRMHEIGFTSDGAYLRNLVVRASYRLLPEQVRRAAYRRVFTTSATDDSDLG